MHCLTRLGLVGGGITLHHCQGEGVQPIDHQQAPQLRYTFMRVVTHAVATHHPAANPLIHPDSVLG